MDRLHSASTRPHIPVARPTNHESMLSITALRRMLAVGAALAESACHNIALLESRIFATEQLLGVSVFGQLGLGANQMFSLRGTAYKVQILRDGVVPALSSRIAELEDMLPVSGQ